MPTITGTDGKDDLIGTDFNDIILGLGDDDNLKGGKGADTMKGGLGNDSYWVDNAGDVVEELAGEGTDRVYATISYALPSNVEELFLGGSKPLNGLGNDLNNYIYGNDASNILKGGGGNDTLDGAGGADTMVGGIGDDWYSVDHEGDAVLENADEGSDGVLSSIDYVLPTNVENLQLSAGAGDIDGYGNDLDNRLYGNEGSNVLKGGGGSDWLRGGGGADTMVGGQGNDRYWVTDAGDVVFEDAGQGIDKVTTTITYTLPGNVENLELASGAGNINGFGNGLDNQVVGNEGDNVLKGGGGVDWLYGLGGSDILVGGTENDVYVITDGNDVVLEKADEGFDYVIASVNHTLAANVEALRLDDGAGNINGTGNDLPNYLQGNAGNNVLSGGLGNDELLGMGGKDTMIGGVGGDWFYWYAASETGTTAATADVIQDFSFAEGDRIHLANIDANVYAAGDQAFAFIGTAAFSGTPGEIRYYHAGGNTYIEMQTGMAVDVEGVIRLNGILNPEASWFSL